MHTIQQTVSKETADLLTAEKKRFENSSALQSDTTQHTNSLDNLITGIEAYKKGYGEGSISFADKVIHSLKQTYDYLLGTNYSSSDLMKNLLSTQKNLTNLQQENAKIAFALEENISSIKEGNINLENKIQSYYISLQESHEKVTALESSCKHLSTDLQSDTLSSLESRQVKHLLRKKKHELDKYTTQAFLRGNKLNSLTELYNQSLQELSHEETMLEFQDLHADIIDLNLNLLNVYASREQKGIDEYAVMKTKAGLASVANTVSYAQQERSTRLDKYDLSSKQLQSYDVVASNQAKKSSALMDKLLDSENGSL